MVNLHDGRSAMHSYRASTKWGQSSLLMNARVAAIEDGEPGPASIQIGTHGGLAWGHGLLRVLEQ